MMKRMLSVLLCLIMIPAMALGVARMPDMRGAVTDAADVLSQQTAEDLAALAQETPVGRLGTPQDVARALLWLADEGSGFITGQIIGVNGGFGE